MYKITIDAPKKMREIAQKDEAESRPYDVCLECPFFSDTCDGPNVLAMSWDRWVEWARIRLHQLGFTYEDWAEKSQIPISTIKSIMTGKTQDSRHSTIRELTRVLVGGCWGQYPCHFASLLMTGQIEDGIDRQAEELSRELKRAESEADALREQLAASDAKTAAQVEKAEREAEKKIEWLKGNIAEQRREKNLYRWASVGLVAFVLILFAVDLLVGDVGWFRF